MNILLPLVLLAASPPAPARHFTVTVVDGQTGRGVPLVELRTVHGVRLWTDSAGVAVFDEPGLLGRDVHFTLSSHGYESPRDGFGIRGRTLRTTPGGEAKLRIRRINVAERLYRITGAGVYRDSVLAGLRVPVREPLLNGGVLGCDSVLNVPYRGKLHWFYGDTSRASHPLGNFNVSGAVSDLPDKGGLDPAEGIDLRWFVDDKGFAKQMAPMPGKGPTWITSVVTLPDEKGRERLYASYVKVKPPLTAYARGIAVYDDAREVFTPLCAFDFAAPAHPSGHAFRHEEGGTSYFYFSHPLPLTRVRATLADFRDPKCYEAWTCLEEGSRLDRPKVARDASGGLKWGWKKNTPPVGPAEQAKLVSGGLIEKHEGLVQLRDRDTGKAFLAHSGSVYYNSYRRRWVMLAVEIGGASSLLGEVWYAEAEGPLGPWAYAVKVATHDRYSFYNPKHHPAFDQHGGRVIYFEGTYTHTFSGNSDATPRYDYNQILYRLDLGDARTALPSAVREQGKGGGRFRSAGENPLGDRIAFFAPDRPLKGHVPVLAPKKGDQGGTLRFGKPLEGDAHEGEKALFFAWPAGLSPAPAATVPLFEFTGEKDGTHVYSTRKQIAGYRRGEKPVCRVWANPWAR